jgi:hypothetical protein
MSPDHLRTNQFLGVIYSVLVFSALRKRTKILWFKDGRPTTPFPLLNYSYGWYVAVILNLAGLKSKVDRSDQKRFELFVGCERESFSWLVSCRVVDKFLSVKGY